MAAQFKVGGKVVCIHGGVISSLCGRVKYTIERGKIYQVEEIRECSCGEMKLHVGIVRPKTGEGIQISRCECGSRVETRIIWINARHFVPIEEQEAKTVTYTKKPQDIPVIAN